MSEYSKLPMLELNDIDITSQMRNDIWKEANKIVNEQYGRCLKLIKSNFKFFNLLINAIKDKPYTSSKLSKDEIANILIANDIKLIINE
jgi:ATP-dependent Zn protease